MSELEATDCEINQCVNLSALGERMPRRGQSEREREELSDIFKV